MALEKKGDAKLCFGGKVQRYAHKSDVCGCEMLLTVFTPPQAETTPCPVVYWLSGLTCNDENFITKAGAQRKAAELGLILVCPDTSPRNTPVPGDNESWDFGVAAGFYVDATEEKWRKNYNMYSYVTKELQALIESNLNVQKGKKSIMGHSMGGHGALIIGLKNPGEYKSISAFAPIANPIHCPWGEKAFSGYLGNDRENWKSWDATELIKHYQGPSVEVLIDQGEADSFLANQLHPENFANAFDNSKGHLTLRRQAGYDHSYYFIATFIDDHLEFHAKHLKHSA